MKSRTLRLAAILAALMLLLGTLPGLAAQATTPQEPAMKQAMEALFAQGKSMQMEYTIELNPALGSLIASLSGNQPDEAGMALVNTLVSAANKLKAVFLAGPAGVSGTVGTEQGILLDFQASANPETKENHVTTSLLPGIALSLDLSSLGAMPTANIKPEQIQQLAAPYLAAFGEFTGKINQAAQKEEGSFEIPGIDTFTTRSQGQLTAHMTADLMENLATIYQNDPAAKQFVEEAMKANKQADLPTGTQTMDDPGKALLEEAKKIREKEDKVLLLATEYKDPAGKTYLELVTPDGAEEALKAGILFNAMPEQGQPGPVDISATILLSASIPAAEGEAPKAIDWLALESDIKEGRNYNDSLINLSFTLTPELPQVQSGLTLSLTTGGMNIGIAYKDSSDTATLESKGSLSLSLMSPEPMLTVHFSAKPVDEQPIAPLLDGTTPVVIKEGETGKEFEALLEASLKKSVPDLLERLKVALPDEAPAIIALLANQESTPQEPLPEPAPKP